MTMALEGIRIIDVTQWQAGSYATTILADMGAEVIHVEGPKNPDSWRGGKSMLGVSLELPEGRHLAFEQLNMNKKGITLNLKEPRGLEILYRLVEEADVVVTNFPKLGVTYDTLSQRKPRIIYARMTGFGTRGPDSGLPSLDIIPLARSGGMFMNIPDGMPPTYTVPGVADRAAALYLAQGILVALLARERLGIGQEINVSQLGAAMHLNSFYLNAPLLMGKEFEPLLREEARNPLYNWYQCLDGQWVVLANYQSQRNWPTFCQAIGMAELERDPRFEDEQKRDENKKELIALLDRVFASKAREEWEKTFKEASGQIIFTRINRFSDVASDPQVIENNYVTQWDHPALGPIKIIGFPVEYSKTPASYRMAAPEFGEHTEQVLTDLLGYSWEEVVELREQGII